MRNPFAAARLPVLESLVGGRLVSEEKQGMPHLDPSRFRAIDATLGASGLPQSGTGQTTLLTGRNAAALFGRHFGPWVPTGLRPLLAEENVFRSATERGLTATLANSYPAGYMSPGGRGARRPGAVPFAAHAAGLLTRDEHSLRAGDAVVSSITTDTWRRYVDPEAPLVEPEAAGRLLARIASTHDLTLFAHFDTDYVGHRGSLQEGVEVLERFDRFLRGLLPALSAETLVVLTSDHGNLEDTTAGHTRNPVPLIAVGDGADRLLANVNDIGDVAAGLLDVLGLRGDRPREEEPENRDARPI